MSASIGDALDRRRQLALLNGVSKMLFFNEQTITASFLKEQVLDSINASSEGLPGWAVVVVVVASLSFPLFHPAADTAVRSRALYSSN